MSKFKNWLHRTRLRGLLMMCVDMFMLTLSFAIIFLINKTIEPSFSTTVAILQLVVLGSCISLAFLAFRTYRNLWYYAESRDYLILMAATCCGYVLYLPIVRLLFPVSEERLPLSTSLLALALPILVLLTTRFAYRRIREWLRESHVPVNRSPLIIVGAGDAAVMLLEEILRNNASTYRPVCLVDDDAQKIGGQIRGVRIDGPISRMPELVKKYRAREILVALPSAGRERNREILDMCMSLGCRVRLLPDMMEIIRCNSSADIMKSVREVQIDDLLGREPVNFENKNVYRFLFNKVVMVM